MPGWLSSCTYACNRAGCVFFPPTTTDVYRSQKGTLVGAIRVHYRSLNAPPHTHTQKKTKKNKNSSNKNKNNKFSHPQPQSSCLVRAAWQHKAQVIKTSCESSRRILAIAFAWLQTSHASKWIPADCKTTTVTTMWMTPLCGT